MLGISWYVNLFFPVAVNQIFSAFSYFYDLLIEKSELFWLSAQACGYEMGFMKF